MPSGLPGPAAGSCGAAAHQHPRALSAGRLSRFILASRVTLSQVQNPALVLVKFHAMDGAPVYPDAPAKPLVAQESQQHLPVWCSQQTCYWCMQLLHPDH